MIHTCCTTSNCAPAGICVRHEDDAGRHMLSRTHANFSEELIRKADNTATCPFYIDKDDVQRTAH